MSLIVVRPFGGSWPRFLNVLSQPAWRKIDGNVNRLLRVDVGTIDLETRAAAESLLAWWHEAGVDVAIEEEPRNWMAPAAQAASVVPSASARPAAASHRRPATAALPATLAEFRAWWASDMSVLDGFPIRRRLAPEGPASVDLMVVIDMPERCDADTARLFSGECGALFDKMIAAIGLARNDLYLASLAPARTPTGRIDEATADRLSPLLDHHIRLAAPSRLWLMGDAASRAVVKMSAGEASGRSHKINHGDRTISTIATVHPQLLLREPKLKARVWKDMQLLIEDSNA